MHRTTRTRTRIPGRTATAALLAVAVAGLTACDPRPGYDGVCAGDDALTGVTVVVDFQQLDGNDGEPAPTIVRCSPDPDPGTPRTGLEALEDAGVEVTGTTRWGLGFVCRIEGRPAVDEPLPIAGNPTYTEPCHNTPPASAYWSYWHADGSGGAWQYSSHGAGARHVTPGGFEGFSFALNAGPTTNPEPRVPPKGDAGG